MVGIGYKGVLFHQYHVPQINKMNCIDVNKNLLCQTVNNFLFMNVSFLLEKKNHTDRLNHPLFTQSS